MRNLYQTYAIRGHPSRFDGQNTVSFCEKQQEGHTTKPEELNLVPIGGQTLISVRVS